MRTKAIRINLENGLDARPVALLVQEASKYECKIYMGSEDKRVNAKSIMGMMTLTLDKGQTITVTADGEDEQTAIENIENYLSGNAE